MYQDLIHECSKEYEINFDWVIAIITVESSWVSSAMRFEKNYQWIYQPDYFAKNNKITLDTETMLQKFSWGLGQIMGALAREQGLKGSLTQLLDPKINIDHICIRLNHLRAISSNDDDIFAMYNGGPGGRRKVNGEYKNQDYVDKVKLHLPNS